MLIFCSAKWRRNSWLRVMLISCLKVLMWPAILLQLSLHASCAQGFFGERQFNCISCPKIPKWWQTGPESSQELWMVDVLNLFLLPLFINDRHETKVTKFWYKCNESFTKHLLFLEYILLYKKCLSLLLLVHRRTQNIMIMDLKKWSQTLYSWNPMAIG